MPSHFDPPSVSRGLTPTEPPLTPAPLSCLFYVELFEGALLRLETEAMRWGGRKEKKSPRDEAGEGVSPLTLIPEYSTRIKCGHQKKQRNGKVAAIN